MNNSDLETLFLQSETNPYEDDQKVIFLCESIELKNCDEKEVLDLPNPTMPLASLNNPLNKRVFNQVNKNLWAGSKIESLIYFTATTSSTSFRCRGRRSTVRENNIRTKKKKLEK